MEPAAPTAPHWACEHGRVLASVRRVRCRTRRREAGEHNEQTTRRAVTVAPGLRPRLHTATPPHPPNMYFLLKMQRKIEMTPKEVSKDVTKALTNKILQKVIGTCSGRYGYVVAVTEMPAFETLHGRVMPGSANIEYVVNFTVCTFRPFKGETVDGIVRAVNKLGFFVTVAALDIFVSKHLVPEDMHFDKNSNPPAFVSSTIGENLKITVGSEVRLRIIGIRFNIDELFAIGTLRDDYLGVTPDSEKERMFAAAPQSVEVGA